MNTAFASFTDGNELYKWMQAYEDKNGSSFNAGLFGGYIAGVVDTGNNYMFCTTPGVSRGQNSAIVAKYLRNNPEKWNMSAASLVVEAMKESFPCKK